MGYALGAEGIEADPDHATFPSVNTETSYGGNGKACVERTFAALTRNLSWTKMVK
jgi:hypothetical protein